MIIIALWLATIETFVRLQRARIRVYEYVDGGAHAFMRVHFRF